MNGYERLAGKLTGLNLYKLDGTTKIDVELRAYGNLLDSIYNKIDQLFESSFVEQLSGIGFTNYIKLFGVSESLSENTVQTMVLNRLSLTNNDFTKAGVIRCIAAGGFTVTILEALPTKTITVTVLTDKNFFKTRQEKEDYIESCLPCHSTHIVVWNT